MGEAEELWVEYLRCRDPDLREKLILRYVHLVKYVAGRLSLGFPSYQDEDDLVGYGVFGLLEALDRYELERGVKFETYAVARIRGAILDGLRAYDQVPISWRRRAKEVEKATLELENELGRSPTDGELAGHLGITLNELDVWMADFGKMSVLSLEETIFATGGDLEGEDEDPVEMVVFNERKELLGAAIDRLSEKERTVVALYYYEGLTVREIGQVMGLSNSRISQLHHRAVLRLRGFLGRLKKKIVG